MTEPIFKAPLPPEGNGFNIPPKKEETEKTEEVPVKKTGKEKLEEIKQKISLYLWYVLGGTFFVGLIFGLLMGGGETVQQAPTCALRQVPNPDIRRRFPLCGRTSKSEACILYIMNTTPYDATVEDFFTRAEQLTERNKRTISLENPMYSKLRIPPGYFAEIKIPSLR